jgi:hypothetical protein
MLVTNVLNSPPLPIQIIDVHDGTVVGLVDPGDEFRVRMGPNQYYDVAINNRGSVAFTGGASMLCQFDGNKFVGFDGGVFRFNGKTITTIALLGPAIDNGAISFLAWPSVNERGQVAFLTPSVSDFCPSTPGLKSASLYVGDGKRLEKIADAFSAPSINNRGEIGFVGLNNGTLSVIVSDGKKTRIVADTNGPFAGFLSGTRFPGVIGDFESGVSLNESGNVAFIGALDAGGLGIFTGPDVIKDKVIAIGDPLAGSSVSELDLSRQSLNNAGQIAFQATLTDGRYVIVRAEPKGAVN